MNDPKTEPKEYAAVNPLAEVCRGLARDRTILVKELRDANVQWNKYEAFKAEQLARIKAIDDRVTFLLDNFSKDHAPALPRSETVVIPLDTKPLTIS